MPINSKISKSFAPAKKASIKKKPLPKSKTEEQLVRRSLHYSNLEGTVTSSSWTIVGSFVSPFAIALRATSAQIGMLSAVQDLFQTLSQIPGAKLTEYYSRKSIWMFSRIMSRLVFGIPLIILAVMAMLSTPAPYMIYLLMAVVACIYFFSGLSTPAWSSLIGDLVSTDIRGRYFGRRNTYLGMAGIATVLICGYLLSSFGFWLLFVMFVLLGVSAIPLFLRMYEPPTKKVFHYKHRIEIHPSKWLTAMRVNHRITVFAIYMVLMSFAVEMAGPFYSVYMLRNLSLSYTTFAVLITLGALARIVSFRYWGRLNDRYGSRKILLVCGTFAIFTPLLWMFVHNAAAIALVNIFDGFIWAGFDLVTFNYLLDITPGDRRPQYVANYNFFVGLGAVGGALMGGLLSSVYGNITLLAFTGLQLVFMTSFLLRACLLIVLPKISEIDVVHSRIAPVRYVFWQAMAVEPIKGISGAIHYTFRYPYQIEKEFKKGVRKLEYKARMVSI